MLKQWLVRIILLGNPFDTGKRLPPTALCYVTARPFLLGTVVPASDVSYCQGHDKKVIHVKSGLGTFTASRRTSRFLKSQQTLQHCRSCMFEVTHVIPSLLSLAQRKTRNSFSAKLHQNVPSGNYLLSLRLRSKLLCSPLDIPKYRVRVTLNRRL